MEEVKVRFLPWHTQTRGIQGTMSAVTKGQHDMLVKVNISYIDIIVDSAFRNTLPKYTYSGDRKFLDSGTFTLK